MPVADPGALLDSVAAQLWAVAQDAVADLTDPLDDLEPLADAGDPALQGRLLDPLALPTGNALLALLDEVVEDLPDGPVHWHGWERASGADRGVALVLTIGLDRATLALSPGPVIDLVVTPGAVLGHSAISGVWQVRADVTAPSGWQASWRPGEVPVAASGTATVSLTRADPVLLGPATGPSVSWKSLTASITASPGAPAAFGLGFVDFASVIVPEALKSLVGDRPTTPAALDLLVDRLGGLRFPDGGVRIPLPGGVALELLAGDSGVVVRPSISFTAALPGLPVTLTIDDLGALVPISLDGTLIGIDPGAISVALPEGMGIDLALPPVSGGGFLREKARAVRRRSSTWTWARSGSRRSGSSPCPTETATCPSWCCSRELPAAGDPARLRVRPRRRRRAGRAQPPGRRRTAARPGRRGQRRPRDVPRATPSPAPDQILDSLDELLPGGSPATTSSVRCSSSTGAGGIVRVSAAVLLELPEPGAGHPARPRRRRRSPTRRCR